jgi:hypothetical protein
MFHPMVGGGPAGPAIYYPGSPQTPTAATLIVVSEAAPVDGLVFTTSKIQP